MKKVTSTRFENFNSSFDILQDFIDSFFNFCRILKFFFKKSCHRNKFHWLQFHRKIVRWKEIRLRSTNKNSHRFSDLNGEPSNEVGIVICLLYILMIRVQFASIAVIKHHAFYQHRNNYLYSRRAVTFGLVVGWDKISFNTKPFITDEEMKKIDTWRKELFSSRHPRTSGRSSLCPLASF